VLITTSPQDADNVVAAAKQHAGVVDAQIVTPPASTGRVVVRVIGSTPVDDARTGALVNALRTDLHTAAPSALVGGPAAQNSDLTGALTGRAPYAIGLILIVAFVLLLVVFRSVVVAITSILLNLLTVGAAFGFATLVFQHGFGSGLLGIEHQQFIDAWAPLFFFALLFGLSMDYQLFLLAAIRERYEATGDTRAAIQEGIARTGRPITNAAVVMIVVFIAFGVTGPIPPTELGVTLAMAVLLDATVVRVLLVPAVMALIGERNWYLPSWLDRILPHVHFTH
jgi:RND superfamily putative drug exporter